MQANMRITRAMNKKYSFKIFVFCSIIILVGLSVRTVFCSVCHGMTKQKQPLVSIAQIDRVLPSPKILNHFTKQEHASLQPVLQWEKVENAPIYELEIYAENKKIFSSNRIYTAGYSVSLPQDVAGKNIYWHVRALNLDRSPITPYSEWETSFVDNSLPQKMVPQQTVDFNSGNGTNLLYPVYGWLPVQGATKYEVEILSQPPQQNEDTHPSIFRIGSGETTASDLYDEEKRNPNKPVYWRVRALKEDGEPLGSFSPAKKIVYPQKTYTVGTFGDSITHGGGAVSYSPGDWEYDYQSYLNFDTINLGRSGDTSASMLERFDQDVLPLHLQYLIIMGGTNSLRGGVSAKSVIDDLQAIKEKCEENGIMPIFLTLPPINPANIKRAFDQDTALDWQRQFAMVNAYIKSQKHIDIATKMTPDDGILPTSLALDGLHPDVVGKKIMANIINEEWGNVIANI